MKKLAFPSDWSNGITREFAGWVWLVHPSSITSGVAVGSGVDVRVGVGVAGVGEPEVDDVGRGVAVRPGVGPEDDDVGTGVG
jgi:hypothetical protein